MRREPLRYIIQRASKWNHIGDRWPDCRFRRPRRPSRAKPSILGRIPGWRAAPAHSARSTCRQRPLRFQLRRTSSPRNPPAISEGIAPRKRELQARSPERLAGAGFHSIGLESVKQPAPPPARRTTTRPTANCPVFPKTTPPSSTPRRRSMPSRPESARKSSPAPSSNE